MMPIRDIVSYWLLLLLILLISASNHPIIVEMSRNAGLLVGSILSRYIIIVFALLFFACLNVKKLFKCGFFVLSVAGLFLIVLSALTVHAFYASTIMYSEIRSISICIGALAIGWLLTMGNKQYYLILILFSLATTFIGLMQVVMNIGGFVIEDSLLTDNKNALGVMLATAAFIFWQLFSNSHSGERFRGIFLISVVLLLAIMLTTRVRSAFLIIVFMFFFSLYEHRKNSTFFPIFFVVIVVVALVFIYVAPIREYVYNSFFQNSYGDVTSGRLERNAAGIRFLEESPFAGALGKTIALEQIHNYPLNQLCAYGIIFSAPLLFLYISFFVKDIHCLGRSSSYDNWNIGYYTLLIPFLNSFSEPTLPFGPGTATVFNFILFGIALRHSYELNHDSQIGLLR